MLLFYNIPCTNYYGNLNLNLKILGYYAHDPPNETLNELKLRLSKPPMKKNIVTNHKIYKYKNIGENITDEQLENEYLFLTSPYQDPFKAIKEDPLLYNLLRVDKKSKKSKKIKVKKLKTFKCKNNKIKQNIFNEIDDNEDDEDDEDDENKSKSNSESNSDSESESECENNEFDMENNLSDVDDDNDNDDTGEFSD